jgi:hypothetical protein
MTAVPTARSDRRTTLTAKQAGESPSDLPVVTIYGTVTAAPRDQYIHDVPLPQRLHPLRAVTAHRSPGGDPVATVPSHVFNNEPLWMPIIEARHGWALVLLPCRPDGTAGWIHLTDSVVVAIHHVHIEVDTRAHTVTLVNNGDRRTWPAGVGKPSSPTPRGRTFVLGTVECGPGLVQRGIALAAHAPTHLAYRAGLSEIGMHTWPTAKMFGRAGGDGSVCIPAEAMTVIEATAPAGTPVLIR